MTADESTTIPDWIEVRRGTAPLVLFAPHGGARVAPRRPGRDNVNDLHTADLTRELGVTCDATWVVNPVRDRNELDLNRTEQLQRHARWLLELLAASLEQAVATHGRAVLLAVHGWNVGQPACDLGVGLIEEGAGSCRRAARGAPTVSPAFLDGTLRRLQRLAATDGTAVTIGARYPAAHPSNVMQLLTSTRQTDADPLLRRLANLAEHVEAAQLELGIPLRWPGYRRAAFLQRLVQVFASDPSTGTGERSGRRAVLACGGRPITRVGLQVATDGLALLTSIDVSPSGATAGRLLVSDAPNRLSLFTGELAERPSPALCVPPLHVTARGRHTFDVRFAGAMLSFPMLTPFSDLERGLASGTLVDARLALRFTPVDARAAIASGGARFGRVAGRVRLGSSHYAVRARAHAVEGMSPGGVYPHVRLVLPETALGDLELSSRGDASPPVAASHVLRGDSPALRHLPVDGTARPGAEALAVRGSVEIQLSRPAHAHLRLETAAGELHTITTTLDRLIPVRRPGRDGTVVETVFAVCRTAGASPGWLELTVEGD